MEQYDPKSIDQRDLDDSDLQDLSTGARRLARLLREMGNASAPDSLLPAIEDRLDLEHGQHFQPAFMEALTQALQDRQWQVRSTAALMVGTLGEYAPRELVTRASHDRDPRVRAALLHNPSGQVKGNQLYRVAIMALQHDEDSRVRVAAVQTLGVSEDLVAMKILEKSLADNDAEVRAAALRSLTLLRERRQPGFRPMENNGTPSIQRQATQVVEQVLRRLDDEDSIKGSAHRQMTRTIDKLQATDLVHKQIGPYKILQLLGSGGYADVYLGKHVVLGTEVAIKVLHTSLLQEQIEQFVLEAQIVASLDHPNIIRVLNFDVAKDSPYLVMEYAPNGTLRQRHPRGTALPLEIVLNYVQQISRSLQYAHDRGIIHRDIKPENMLLGQKGDVLLGDFGIAIGSQGPSAHMAQDIMGTILYMAPEQIRGKPTRASDQYSLGVVVYEWLSGSHPFKGNLWDVATQHLRKAPPMLHTRAPHTPQSVERVVMRALAKDPDQRYESITAFEQAFSHACEQVSPVSASGERLINTKRHGKRRHKRLTVFLILLILMLLIGSIASVILSLFYATTVIITPAHVAFAQNYTLSAVTDLADSSKLQVQARFISATAPPQSTTAQSSGASETPGTRAQGTVTFFNGLSIAQTIDAGTTITSREGVQITTDEVAIVPPSNPPYFGSTTVPAHAIDVGIQGNIVPGSINQLCCTNNKSITVKNLAAFSGGQDPQPYIFVRPSDIDRAANFLEVSLKAHAQALLLAQVPSNEGILSSIQCDRRVYADHQPNDRVATFRVTMTLICTGEIYDTENAKSMAILLLKEDAAKKWGGNYYLKGKITTHLLQVSQNGAKPGIIVVHMQAQGTWIYQFKPSAREKLVRMIVGKSKREALNLLLRQTGISRVEIQTPWWVPWILRDTLPPSDNRILLVTNSVINQL